MFSSHSAVYTSVSRATLCVAFLHLVEFALRFYKQLWSCQNVHTRRRECLRYLQRILVRLLCPCSFLEIRCVRATELLTILAFAAYPEVGADGWHMVADISLVCARHRGAGKLRRWDIST